MRCDQPSTVALETVSLENDDDDESDGEGVDDCHASGDEDADHWSMVLVGDYAVSRDEPPSAETTVSPVLRERIEAADVSVVNVEAPIAPDGATAIAKSGPTVENPPEAAAAVADAGFDICTLANNHVGDFGAEGLVSTVDALRAVGCETVGVGESHDAAVDPLEVSVGDTSLGIVNVCEREFSIAGEDTHGAAWIVDRRAREAIRTADREFDAVVVIAHGGVEYVPFPPVELQGLLREFVDIGADLVVGHHPHVPQGWERYGDGAIFYSLGNFLYDRLCDSENTSWGLALEVAFEGATPVAVDLVPTETVDGVVHPLGRTRDRDDHLAYLRRLTELTADSTALEAYWQVIAVQVFYERYSSWLHRGCGLSVARARSNPTDPDLQRQAWDPEARRRQLLTLLTIVRTESHRWLLTRALGVLSGETDDRRTPAIREEAQVLLSRTER